MKHVNESQEWKFTSERFLFLSKEWQTEMMEMRRDDGETKIIWMQFELNFFEKLER